jgi:hypothetical protein
MPNLCSLLAHSASLYPCSNRLPSPASRTPIKQVCMVGVGFLGFFGDFAKKFHIALSISHLILKIRYSIMSLKDMTDPDGFLGFFGDVDKKFYTTLSISQILLRMRSSVMSLKGLKGPEGFLGFLAKFRKKNISHFPCSAGFVWPPTLISQNRLPSVPTKTPFFQICRFSSPPFENVTSVTTINTFFPKSASCMDNYHPFYQKTCNNPACNMDFLDTIKRSLLIVCRAMI